MKCEACFEIMDELIEGELDDSLGRDAIAHMAMCGSCSQLYANLRDEQEVLRKYLLEVEPAPTLWENLRVELERERVINDPQAKDRSQRWFPIVLGGLNVRPQIAVALVLITIGLGIGIMVWRTSTGTFTDQARDSGVPGGVVRSLPDVNPKTPEQDPDAAEKRAANDNERKIRPFLTNNNERASVLQLGAGRASRRKVGSAPVVATVDQVALSAERQYLSAIEILSRDIRRRRAVIPPALLSHLEAALAEADRNIAATRKAAGKQPRDPVAVQYVASAYENKVDLLREVANW
jgi:hypothetical protein